MRSLSEWSDLYNAARTVGRKESILQSLSMYVLILSRLGCNSKESVFRYIRERAPVALPSTNSQAASKRFFVTQSSLDHYSIMFSFSSKIPQIPMIFYISVLNGFLPEGSSVAYASIELTVGLHLSFAQLSLISMFGQSAESCNRSPQQLVQALACPLPSESLRTYVLFNNNHLPKYPTLHSCM